MVIHERTKLTGGGSSVILAKGTWAADNPRTANGLTRLSPMVRRDTRIRCLQGGPIHIFLRQASEKHHSTKSREADRRWCSELWELASKGRDYGRGAGLIGPARSARSARLVNIALDRKPDF